MVEGANVAIEFRWARGDYSRLPALAAEFVDRAVNLFVVVGGQPSVLAVKGATSTIPIAFAAGGDPVELGLVASFNRPGSNLTSILLGGSSLSNLYESVYVLRVWGRM